ncbi:MAG: FeS assembly protein IscX [Myxococcota bacterium]|jgi:FeS assembly protein IscX
MGLRWVDCRPIGEKLYDRFPELHPLSIRFGDLRRWVIELDDFDDVPSGSSEGLLEAIQMIWYEEWQEDHDPSEDPYRYDR